MPASGSPLAGIDLTDAAVGILIVALTILVRYLQPRPSSTINVGLLDEPLKAAALFATFCFVPSLRAAARWLRPRWRQSFTVVAILGICVLMTVFIVHYGRWQYGGWDFNLLVDTGWRQIIGQHAFTDFPATTPPGFNAGLRVADALFGSSWDANIYLAALFASATFLWLYRLMTALSMGRIASVGVAFAIECAAMLTTCFWWFNNTTMVVAALFFLSGIALLRQPDSRWTQASYVVSLAILSLLKPNIAGPLMVVEILFLLVMSTRRITVIVLTLLSAAIALATLLLFHVSIPAMLTNYHSVAAGRALFGSRYGYRAMPRTVRHLVLVWVAVISVPVLAALPRMAKAARALDWRCVALCLFLLFSLPLSLYGVATNSDIADMQCCVLLASSGFVIFGLSWGGAAMRRFFIALIVASIVGNLGFGATRLRVLGIGSHMFFEWRNNENLISSGYLKNMRVSLTMMNVMSDVDRAVAANPKPYFFGPRLEWNYARLGMASPDHFPVIWDPGAGFAESEQDRYIQNWNQHGFQTLIFLNGRYPDFWDGNAYTFYPKEFRELIDREYTRDDSLPYVTVYRLRAGGARSK